MRVKMLPALRRKIRIRELNNVFVRDRWGNLTKCFWNKMIKEEILKLEKEDA